MLTVYYYRNSVEPIKQMGKSQPMVCFLARITAYQLELFGTWQWCGNISLPLFTVTMTIIWSPAAYLNHNIWVIAPSLPKQWARMSLAMHVFTATLWQIWICAHHFQTGYWSACRPLLTWCHLLTMTDFQLLVSPLCTFRNVLTWFDRLTPAWDLIGGRTERLLTHERIAGTEVNLKIMMCRLLQWAHTLSTSKFYHGSWHEDTLPSTVFQLGAIRKVRGHVMNLIKGAHEY